MRKLMLIAWWTLCIGTLWGQDSKAGYLFDSFENALIYYKDGRIFNVPLNYNLLSRQYEFIDKNDNNRKKEFSEAGMIVSIELGKRKFLPPSEGATEIIQPEPAFYVTYQGVAKKKSASVGYGGTTDSGAANSLTGIKGNFIVGGISADQKTLTSIDKVYRVRIGKKMKKFYDKKRFLKLFPRKENELDKYIEENKTNFDIVQQVLDLYNYAVGLK